MSSAGDWMSGYGPEAPTTPGGHVPYRPAPEPAAAGEWTKGQKRTLVEVMCCEECGGLSLRRRDEYGSMAYWQCEKCAHRQKEPKAAGRRKASLAGDRFRQKS